MKTKLLISMLMILVMLTACSSKPDYDIHVTKPLYFQKDKEVPFEITVTEKEKAAKGLKISAEIAMSGMDHGKTNVTFTEGEKGTYASQAKLAMAGKYEIAFTIEKGGEKTEKVIQYTVTKPEGVASINGQWIMKEDLEFYSFINKLHIAISRETDKEKYKGKALEDALAYWDAQEKLNQDKNQLLTQIIRLRAMALLGAEKGHQAKPEEVKAEIEKVRKQYEEQEVAKSMIKEFGEDRFWSIQEKQYEMIVLSQKVQNDLIQNVKKENPKAGDQEVMFLAQKKYEELLVSQVNSLKIEIL